VDTVRWTGDKGSGAWQKETHETGSQPYLFSTENKRTSGSFPSRVILLVWNELIRVMSCR